MDLLKLLDLDSSREELAKEFGCPADQMSDSARMNVWLHKEVLGQIATNGGNIPVDLLDLSSIGQLIKRVEYSPTRFLFHKNRKSFLAGLHGLT